ncbi:ATP-dependent 26S proteasome regulatory subunit [Candidatus Nanohalococcus occultus]|uniref:ATP-dependent 26S proteasome regulatory subunit n=2 Tax=Candidatus Nanohalococcus occultus TaxID=2978047 RepID=A0ABY8CEJ3_9ARCH|nr:ATP-dependent 26S proteasome regulatory subunit [Candidatus Nanohaloarchaeota archaeon SVXNc]
MVSKVKKMTEDENTEGKQEEEKSGKKQRVQFPQYFNKNQGTDNPNGTALKTPVLRGVVVSEFDGDRIWVEASGNMKGRYGVEVPNGYDPEDFTAGTEVALDPNTFTVTDVVDKSKDAVFNAVDTKVTFQDIGGLDNIIKAMKSNVGAQLDSDKKQKIEDWGLEMDKSILLVGRPGTGKTHLVKAVSNEYDAEMFMINGPQLVEKFIGEGAKKVKRLYEQARASDKPSIIFIDEIDAIAKKRLDDRRHGGEEVERTMSQLLSELDGLDTEEGGNVISIFASNKPDIMDPALLNRCNALEVPVPTKEAKREILQVHTRSLDLDDSVDLEIIADEMEDDYTGRDIKQIVKQAAVNALERYEDVSEAEISMQDFQEAVEDLREGNLGAEKDFLADDKMTPEEMFA